MQSNKPNFSSHRREQTATRSVLFLFAAFFSAFVFQLAAAGFFSDSVRLPVEKLCDEYALPFGDDTMPNNEIRLVSTYFFGSQINNGVGGTLLQQQDEYRLFGSVLVVRSRNMLEIGIWPVAAISGIVFLLIIGIVVVDKRRAQQLMVEKTLLQLSDERFRLALKSSSVVIWDYDVKTKTIIQSEHSQQHFGEQRKIENVPESLIENGVIHPNSAENFRRMVKKLHIGEKEVEDVLQVRACGRTNYFYERIHYTNLFDANGEPYWAIGTAIDESERQETILEYARELQFQQVMSQELYAVVSFDLTTQTLSRLESQDSLFISKLQGVSLAEFCRTLCGQIVEGDQAQSFFNTANRELLLKRYYSGQRTFNFDYLIQLFDGQERWMREDIHLMCDAKTKDVMAFFCFQDIDEEKRHIERLSSAAQKDSMTGLLNHDAIISSIRDYLVGEGACGYHALFVVDVDNFKQVNDTFGHCKGDEVLVCIASRLQHLFRTNDLIGRVGGDEFLILMKNVNSASLVCQRAQELIESMQFPCKVGEHELIIGGSVGICCYHADQCEFEALYRQADKALYIAKQEGKNRFFLHGHEETCCASQ